MLCYTICCFTINIKQSILQELPVQTEFEQCLTHTGNFSRCLRKMFQFLVHSVHFYYIPEQCKIDYKMFCSADDRLGP